MKWPRQAATMTEGKRPPGDFLCRVMQCEAVIRMRPCRGCMTETITTNAFNDVPDNERRERAEQPIRISSLVPLRSHRRSDNTRRCLCLLGINYPQSDAQTQFADFRQLRLAGRFLRGSGVSLQRCNTNSSFL